MKTMKGIKMNHSSEAIESAKATADFTGWNLDEYASARNWTGVGLVGISQHRDSDAVERSNFDAVRQAIENLYGEDSVDVVSFGHWAFGWVEILAYDYENVELSFIESIHKSLQDYAIYDEFLWSEYEWADNHPAEDNVCYSDDVCPCELEKAW